jgi:hypothetical protein
MLLGAVGGLIAWAIVTLILRGGSGAVRIALAATAGFIVATAGSWAVAILLLGPDTIPVGGIVGAAVGAGGAIAAARRKAKPPIPPG